MPSGVKRPSFALMIDAIKTESDSASIDSPDTDWQLESNLAARLVAVTRRQSDATAVTTASVSWSYRELLTAAQRVATVLRNHPAFSPGSRVVLLLPNSVQYIAAFLGTLLADGVVVPLPPTTQSHALDQICTSTEAVAIIVPPDAKRQPHFINLISSQRLTLGSPPSNDPGESVQSPTRGDNDLAAIFYTSGSMGDPKGVMLSHRNFIENASSIQQYLEIQATDRPLCVLPFYHAFGNSVLQSHLLAGANLILDGKTVFPETLITAISKHRATSVSAVPDLIRLLLERTSLGQTPTPTLRYMAVAGGSLPHDMAVAIAHRIAPARFFVMYGQTEATARLAYVPPEHLTRLASDCIGRAIPGVELEVVDESGRQVPLGETGELRARGDNIMLGYWRDTAGTTQRLCDGWLSTGDLAVTDNEGWIYYRGRRNAIVKIAGFRVHPADLEEFAVRRLLARQAVAVAFELPQVGTRLALYISLTSANALTITEMMARCRAELPRHLVPNFIQPVEDFPLNSGLKIDRFLLSEMAKRDAGKTQPILNSDQAVGK